MPDLLQAGLDSTFCLGHLRRSIGDTDSSSGARWTDAALLGFIDRANKRVVQDVLFPDARVLVTTVANVQLYQLPLLLRFDRMYLNGELITPSSKATLEGQQLNMYDSRGVGQNQPQPYSDAPPNTTGLASPLWMVQSPLSYPNQFGQWEFPKPDAGPWYWNSAPRLFWHGGWIGIEPIPANNDTVATIAVDGVVQPQTIMFGGTVSAPQGIGVEGATTQPMTTPGNFLEAITWAATALAFFGNTSQKTLQKYQFAEQQYVLHKRRLITWLGDKDAERNGPKPQAGLMRQHWRQHSSIRRYRG